MLYKAFSVTLKDALAGTYSEPPPYSLYVVRDGETVFYVGQTTDAIETRLQRHALSSLGQFITANAPESDGWQVELVDHRDCAPAVRAGLWPTLPDGARLDPDIAEIALIRVLRPCLNSTYNTNPRPLPERYQCRKAGRVRYG